MSYSLRQQLGALVYDLPRLVWAMRPSNGARWLYMRNRDERFTRAPRGKGVRCDWQWTSDLHIANVFPSLGRALMKRALRDWPIELRVDPVRQSNNTEVSFIIGHRGVERLPHLLLTLKSIAAQIDVSFECIVVEQSTVPEVREDLPSWVRFIHTPVPYADMPYSRAWAFNVGARAASGQVLVLHDNDMLAPKDYAKEIAARAGDGYEVMNLKRFIFFLNSGHSARALRESELPLDEAPKSVMQNAEGGGSLAIMRDAFFAIGGLDESFVGWGGEDVEFWERAKTLRVWPYGYLPLVHLWHEPQPGKRAVNGNGLHTAALMTERLGVSPSVRIEELRKRDFGQLSGVSVDSEQTTQSFPTIGGQPIA